MTIVVLRKIIDPIKFRWLNDLFEIFLWGSNSLNIRAAFPHDNRYFPIITIEYLPIYYKGRLT